VISINISTIHPGFRSLFTIDILYLSFIHPAPYSLFASDIFDFSFTVIVFLGEGVTLLMVTEIKNFFGTPTFRPLTTRTLTIRPIQPRSRLHLHPHPNPQIKLGRIVR